MSPSNISSKSFKCHSDSSSNIINQESEPMVHVKGFHSARPWFHSGSSESKISLVVSFLGLANLNVLNTNTSIPPQSRMTGRLFRWGPGIWEICWCVWVNFRLPFCFQSAPHWLFQTSGVAGGYKRKGNEKGPTRSKVPTTEMQAGGRAVNITIDLLAQWWLPSR